MADISKTIEIVFFGDDKLSGKLGDMSGAIGKFDAAIQGVAEPLANVGDAILKVDGALAVMVAGGMAVAITQAGKWGDSFAEISTLLNLTGTDLSTFEGDILSYARSSTSSLDDISDAMYTALSFGADYEDAIESLGIAERLAIASKTSLSEATEVLTGAMNSYGAKASEVTDYSDSLFTTVRIGGTTMEQLTSTIGGVSAIAANAGISFDGLNAAIAVVTAAGNPTSQAVTSIKSAISAIIKPTQEATDTADALGLKFNASALATKGLDGVLKDVYKATGGATSEITKLFGSVEALPAVMTLGKDTTGKYADALKEFADKAGATAEAYKKMADNFGLANQNLANNVRVTFIEVGKELIGNYSGIVEEIADIFSGIGKSVGEGSFDPLFKAIEEAGKDIIKFLDELGESMPEALSQVDWSGFIESLQKLGGSIGGMFEEFDPSDPESVARAIQGVVDSAESLITITKGMVDSFKPFVEGILNSVEAFNALDESDKESAGNILGLAQALTTLGTGITTAILLIGDSAEKIGIFFDVIIGAIEMLWGGFKVTIQGTAGFVLAAIDEILRGLESVTWGDWNDKVKAMRAGVAEQLEGLEERFNTSVQEVNDGLGRITDNIDIEDINIKADLDTETVQTDADKIRDIAKAMEDGTYVVPLEMDTGPVLEDWAGLEDVIKETDATIAPDIDTTKTNEGVEEIKATVEGSNPKIKILSQYTWTDKGGGTHTSDRPPDPADVMGEVTVKEVKIPIDIDKDKVVEKADEVGKAVEEKLSGFEMAMEVETKIETNFDQVNNALSTSQAAYEAYAGTVEAAYTSGAEIIAGASDAIASLASTFTEASGLDKYKVEEWTNTQQELQDREMDLREKLANQNEFHLKEQEKLIKKQILALENHRKTLEKYIEMAGDDGGTITISAQGVEPELEAFMWKLLKKIQIRANESGAEFLLAAAA